MHLNVSLGPLTAAIHTTDSRVLQVLQRVYADWGSSSVPHLHLYVNLVPGTSTVPLSARAFTRQGSLFIWETPHVRLEVHPHHNTAFLTGATAHLLADVDHSLRALVALCGPRRRALLLHASGVSVDGQGVLFIGPSGSGKSTAAQNRLPHARLLADDLVLLAEHEGTWSVFPAPFERRHHPVTPLEVVAVLVQDHPVRAVPLPASRAAAHLLRALPAAPHAPLLLPTLFRHLHKLTKQTTVVRLYLRPDPSYWDVLAPYLTDGGNIAQNTTHVVA